MSAALIGAYLLMAWDLLSKMGDENTRKKRADAASRRALLSAGAGAGGPFGGPDGAGAGDAGPGLGRFPGGATGAGSAALPAYLTGYPPQVQALAAGGYLGQGRLGQVGSVMVAPAHGNDATGMVPVGGFDRPMRATKHRNVGDLHERVAMIRKLIREGASDPRVRRLAQHVLARRCPGTPGGWCTPEKDWKAEADALFGFVRANMRYTKDPAYADAFTRASRSLFDRPSARHGMIGDCDDYVVTLGALLASVGHNVSMVVAEVTPGPRGPNHIWLRDNLPKGGAVTTASGVAYPLDASVNVPPGWEAPRERLKRVWVFPV